MSLPERIAGSPLVQPNRTGDYRLLVFGAVVSLLSDGFYFVALAWQVAARTDPRFATNGGIR
jgi:hypothetical protein